MLLPGGARPVSLPVLGLRFQAMNLAIARYWQAAAAQTQAWKTSW